ncbi:hypothetical protein HGI30_16600 [Paenibacillus albicereus]|uniref:N-acetyltransferase domain-containing protein n=1 Tax=Paenibacillus albicereus TaxID=2726185 RepID=A0A6H2H020_9BACL|nr:GNAT family N-acetyltransferase [Paenibacillus albicereus]QJC53033.1 hypothetical protein HGI30_16600 [Paenibacillus albicereus]
MKAMLLTPKQWTRSREPLLRLMSAWGGGRLSAAGLAALKELRAEELEPAAGEAPEAAVAVLVEQGRTAGIAFARKAGREACLVAVSPPSRGQGAGSLLLRELRRTWGALDCRVAADNAASMKMCFRAGMAAVALEEGPTGKPTLVFRSGAGARAAEAPEAAPEAQAVPPAQDGREGGPRAEPNAAAHRAPARLEAADAGSGHRTRPAGAAIGAGAARKRRSEGAARALLPEKSAASRRDNHGSAGARHLNVIPQ